MKLASLAAIALLLLLTVLLIAFYSVIHPAELRRLLISEVEKRTGLQARVGEASIRMGWVLGISFNDFALTEPGKTGPVATAEKIVLRVGVRPLLEGRMLFNEIRLYRLKLLLLRDEAGKVALLDFFLNLSFLKRIEADFALDLRRIRFEEAEVTLVNRQGDQQSLVARLDGMELSLQRIPAAKIGNETGRLPLRRRPEGIGEFGIEFNLRAALEKEGARGGLMTKGKILFPVDGFDFRKAWFEAEAQMENLMAGQFWDYYAPHMPRTSIRGILAPRFQWKGSLAQGGHLKGEVVFKRLEIRAAELFAAEIAPGDGRIGIEVAWNPREIRFSQFDFHSNDLTLSAAGTLRDLAQKDPYVELRLTTPFLPLPAVRKYFLLRSHQSSAWGSWIKALNQGEIRLVKAGVAGQFSKLFQAGGSSTQDQFWFEAELREASLDFPGDSYLPVRRANGRLALEKGSLQCKGITAMYGNSRIVEIEGVYKGFFEERGLLDFRLQAELDLAEFRQQVNTDALPFFSPKLSTMLRELNGKARLALTLQKAPESPYQYNGKLSLENARARLGEITLTQLKGDLSFSPQELQANRMTALLAGFPVNIRLGLKDYASSTGTFDLTADSSGIRTGVVTALLFAAGSPEDAGAIRGTLRYQGSLASSEYRKLSGALEVSDARFTLAGKSLESVNGKVQFDSERVNFQGVSGRIFETDFDLSGQWRFLEKPQFVFVLSFPDVDLDSFLARIAPESQEGYDRLQARGKVYAAKAKYERFDITDVKTDLVLERRTWRLENFSARSSGGTVQGKGLIDDGPERLGYAFESKIQGVPVQNFLGWFGMEVKEITGNVHFAGNFESRGKTRAERKNNLNGGFQLEIKEGTLKRVRVLVQILNIVDLSRWFSLRLPDLNKEGIHFRRITGDFKVSQGLYVTENLFVDSDDLRITGAGKVDGVKGEIDFVIAVRPFPGMDSAVSFIPLLGTGLAAIKNSFLVASFRVQGPIENPSVTPAPLSTLSEFFFGALAIPKGIIGIPAEQKK
ncbi:MAG: AsmA-like C-terminal domain-containing protein [Deltaproteobacteria bacterium]|nr:AsmA-like C-terminal domain-containing protein [Deltaproteobacteria bacterium]